MKRSVYILSLILILYIAIATITFFLIPDNSLFIFFVTYGSFSLSWTLVTYKFEMFFIGCCLIFSLLTFLMLSILFFNYSNLILYSFSFVLYLFFYLLNTISFKIYNKNIELLGGASTFRLTENTTLIDLIFHFVIIGLTIIYALFL
jgi:hypothetical protein